MRVVLVSLVSGLLLAVSPAVGAELVTNGGFETGDFTGWTITGTGNYGISNILPHSGTYTAWFGKDGSPADTTSLSEVIPTVPGQTYFASFWISNVVGSTPQNSFQVYWDGNLMASSPPNLGSVFWTELDGMLTATKSQTELRFVFYNGPNSWWALDDISILTPEPASVLLFVGGLALTAALRRRKAAAR